MQHWKIKKDKNDIVWLCLDKAETKANVLSAEVLNEFNEILESLTKEPPAGLVIWSGKN